MEYDIVGKNYRNLELKTICVSIWRKYLFR